MDPIEIIPYSPELRPFFKSINQAWVEKFFSVEAFDQAQFDNPEEIIINPGGVIIFARQGEEILGTVGLHKISEDKYELIKMGVSASAQGKGVGMILGLAILNKAKELGAKEIVLYSHTMLVPAMKIYYKLGFKKAELESGKYDRCDIKMVLAL